MKSSFNLPKKSGMGAGKKIVVFLLVFVMLFSFLITPLKPANAQMVVTDSLHTAWTAGKSFWDKVTNTLKLLLLKGGAMAYQQVLRTALNKVAYDTANYLGSGGKGQKPLFITQNWGDYLAQVGDEAAGQFVENFAANLSKPISTECQNKYQECAEGCLAPQAPDDAFCGEEGFPPCEENNCLQSCKQAATNCDAKTSVAGSGAGTQAIATTDLNSQSFNVCAPSSLEAKLKIGLGLVEQQRPGAPNCTASDMVKNWKSGLQSEYDRLADFKDPNFLKNYSGFFNPNSNDLGIYMSARTDMVNKQATVDANSKLSLGANKGWLDVTNIAKKIKGTPQNAERQNAITQDNMAKQMARTTGDILVDAANVFLNQIANTAFQNLMGQLGKKASEGNVGGGNDGGGGPNVNDPNSDPNILYGEGNLKEVTASIIKPDFGVAADYDILSQLVICPDPKNPGPTNCVIDDKLLQGITEKRTIIEAIKSGYIHGDWQLTKDTIENTYSLRNISILRKYRILPVGWEEAINKAYADQNNIKKVTVMDLVSCFSTSDSHNQFSADFDQSSMVWCEGLVDPNWVLKAPLNLCRKQGPSAQVISKMVMPSIPSFSGNPYTPSTLNITRAEDYCADEQTCIKEKDDGSCEAYGYCNEEKRTWNFSSPTCDPVYNTCKTFINPTSGKNVSYLENTLNYEGCDSESAGCRQYSYSGNFSADTGTVTWDANKKLYLNKNTVACNNKDEGCTELLRVKPTWGANLVMDADFGNENVGDAATGTNSLGDWFYWSSGNTDGSSRVATIIDASTMGVSGKALKLQVTRAINSDQIVLGTYSDASHSLLPDNFQLISGQSYTVSADVYLHEGSNVHIFLGPSEDGFVKSTNIKDSWQHLSITRFAGGSFSDASFGINADNNVVAPGNKIEVYIKNVKFEVSNFETGFNLYGAYKVYEKIIPPYLEKVCYKDAVSATKDYELRADAPGACSNFARKCNREEVGCESFTEVKNGLSVSAQVTSADYCPGECLGYDTYISKEDHFNAPQAANLIPSTAKECSAEAVGCNEFTNLDSLNQGGERKEYYSFLKQCIKPGQAQCGSFYSWEGTDSGYQLRSYNLKVDPVSNGPAVTSPDNTLCTAAIYNKPLGDPQYNADCREFYNSAGGVSYHLISRTITCSDNCLSYRMSDNSSNGICQNGGVWSNSLNACVYQAIPGEGKTCTAVENGCREYNGNDGNNVRMLSYYDYETGYQGWSANCVNSLFHTTIANNKNGHSLLYNSTSCNNSFGYEETQAPPQAKLPIIKQVFAATPSAAAVKVGALVAQGKSYNLRFIAKADNDARPQIYLYNNSTTSPAMAAFSTSTLVIKGGGEWNIYQTNLDNLDHAPSADELLVITADKDFYFDDVILTEITDRYYLIKDSSKIPDICYYDILDNYQGADYNLGCSQYLDRANLKHNLHKFSKLCSSSAVGCEQMIATQNYSPYKSGIWKDTNNNGVCDSDEPDCIKVDADKALYAIYDPNKQCNPADLGCSRLGESTVGATDWSDVYKKNNPNLYDKILCGQDAVGCEEWSATDGTLNYFRDPGYEACQYRASQDVTIAGKVWYKIPVKRCDINNDNKISGSEKTGKICGSANDCADKPCIIDTNDYPCFVSNLKTFGLGGAGNQIPTPDQQAGLCEPTASGCTEYIDPVAQFAPNLVYNPGFIATGGNDPEGWGSNGGGQWGNVPQNVGPTQQVLVLEPNKLYVFSTRDNNSLLQTKLNFMTGARELLIDNTLATNSVLTLTIPAQTNRSIIFASINNKKVRIDGGDFGKTIEIKELPINYQLQENIDKKSCNGIVNFDSGCILFNERSVNGASGMADLSGKWDAQASDNGKAPQLCDEALPGSCSANQLIKVRPNRICSKWFSCLTYVQDPTTKEQTCYAVGQCTRLDDRNECANFEDAATSTQIFNKIANKNASGLYLLNKYPVTAMKEVGLNSEAHYDFEDSVPTLSCVKAGTSNEPCNFNKNIIADLLVREPENAPTDYPAHGATYLKVPAAFSVSPQSSKGTIKLIPGKDYYINFLVNTKGSGLAAKVVVKDYNTGNIFQLSPTNIFTANDGWERKIAKFTAGASEARIVLGSSGSSTEGNVYFDDINIEPVLEVSSLGAAKQYVSRECRLYPTNDSLTCVNKNNNVLKDGWEGYCLEYDPNNKKVCLSWYPVDQISSSKTTRNTLGYSGKFPLNYCTEVNGNFTLVEKRREKLVGAAKWCYPNVQTQCVISGSDLDEIGPDWSWWRTNNRCVNNTNNPGAIKSWCGTKAVGKYWLLIVQNWGGIYFFCEPAYAQNALLSVNEKNYDVVSGQQCNANGGNMSVGAYSNWYKYDGLDNNNDATYLWDPGNGNAEIVGKNIFDEEKNADPPIRIYDHDNPPSDEDGLKLLSGKDTDKIYNLTCNRFEQLVDNNGENKAWVARVGINSTWPTSTPAFWINNNQTPQSFYGSSYNNGDNIMKFGRNRGDVPFGAATWPDNFSIFNSQPIKLKNQFSKKNNETIFAGRPYGCDPSGGTGCSNNAGGCNGANSGCANIGQCSLDPDVYCVLTGDPLYDKSTCSEGGYGTCVPLWGRSLETWVNTDVPPMPPLFTDYRAIFKTLFLKNYNAYYYDKNLSAYITDSLGGQQPSDPQLCVGASRYVDSYQDTLPHPNPSSQNSYCYIKPVIVDSSVVLKLGNTPVSFTNPIPKKGVYSLEFSTKVDPEQQPLKEIQIQWENGVTQVIVGQDNRPDPLNPHIFYHYYNSSGSKAIKIKIIDNWGKYSEWPPI